MPWHVKVALAKTCGRGRRPYVGVNVNKQFFWLFLCRGLAVAKRQEKDALSSPSLAERDMYMHFQKWCVIECHPPRGPHSPTWSQAVMNHNIVVSLMEGRGGAAGEERTTSKK